MFDLILLLAAFVLGIIAALTWRRRGQSVRKGFGFTFHWWSLGDLAGGVVIAFLSMLGIFLVELLLGGIRIQGFQAPNISDIMSVAFKLLFYALFEEIFFRSMLLSGLVILLRGRKWAAILITAAFFGLAHISNPHATWVSAFGNALGGVIYGMAFLGGSNIWLPLGLHFAWNFVQGPLFGFPVSGLDFGGLLVLETTGPDLLTGGAYGPEAGLVGMFFRFVIMAMLLFYLQWRCHHQGDWKTLHYPIQIYANPPRA